jgi:hypothetical protein
MTSFVNYKKGQLNFDYDPTGHQLKNITLNGNNLELMVEGYLKLTNPNIKYPFGVSTWQVFFDDGIKEICNTVFESVKIIKTSDKDDVLAAFLATYLFQYLGRYWFESLLDRGMHMIGIAFWQSILIIVKEWEDKNKPITIHKGTPYFFLAETYILTGDRDNGFVFLYNAIEDDKKLPSLNYPADAPSYLSATMSDKPRNHMSFLITELRNKLGGYISEFRKNYKPSFVMLDFDKKFLQNYDLSNTVYFFVYNFLYLFEEERNTRRDLLHNEFSKLKALDLFFNFGLIIDVVLRHSCFRSTGNRVNEMNESVLWLCDNKGWMPRNDLTSFWGRNHLKINSDPPDIVIPKLLNMTLQYNGNVVRKEVFTILTAYHLRNYAGHNIVQQSTLVSQYDEIIQQLFMALFLAVDSL